MRPLKGIVVGRNGGRLRVRLDSRATVHIAKHKGLKLGDHCYILYDYTRMRARRVWTVAEYMDRGDEPQLDWDDDESPDWVPANELAAQSDDDSVVSL